MGPRSGSGAEKRLFAFEPRKTALLVIDMQNDFVRQGAMIYVPDAAGTIPPIRKLLRLFRRKKLPVVYTKSIPFQFRSLMSEYIEILHPERVSQKTLVKGHKRYYPDVGRKLDCTDIVEELYPRPGEPVIEKVLRNAFENTPLEYILRALQIEYLVLVGTATHVCVDSTAKAAFDRQFKVAMVSDGVSSFAPDLHAATLQAFGMWGRVMTAEEVSGELS